jgi:hypothetical protein
MRSWFYHLHLSHDEQQAKNSKLNHLPNHGGRYLRSHGIDHEYENGRSTLLCRPIYTIVSGRRHSRGIARFPATVLASM